MVGILVSFWGGLFSGAMLVLRSVEESYILIHELLLWLPQTDFQVFLESSENKAQLSCPCTSPVHHDAKFHASGRSLSRPWKIKSALADWKSLPTR